MGLIKRGMVLLALVGASVVAAARHGGLDLGSLDWTSSYRSMAAGGVGVTWAAPAGGAGTAAIDVDPDVRAQLAVLWTESVNERAERVACLGGERDVAGVIHVHRLLVVSSRGADSAEVSAATSLRACRPPVWFGTVHTHIITAGGIPYVTFSAADRNVIGQWERQNASPGVFCVLYTESDAHCEAGTAISAELHYRDGAPHTPRRPAVAPVLSGAAP